MSYRSTSPSTPPTDSPLIVQEVPYSSLDERGLPESDRSENVRRGLVFASLNADDSADSIFTSIGCPNDSRVLAWIDADGSTGLTTADFNERGTATEDDVPNLDRFLDARPTEGDWVAVSDPVHDPRCSEDDVYPVSLTLKPPLP